MATTIASYVTGQAVLAWQPRVTLSEFEGQKFWQGEYQPGVVLGLIAEDGPAREPYYMIEFVGQNLMSGRDESDLLPRREENA